MLTYVQPWWINPDETIARAAQHLLLIDRAAPAIPTVPAHRRRQRDLITHDDAKRFLCCPPIVLRSQCDSIGAGFLKRTGNLACGGVDRQPLRQPVNGKLYWPLAGGGNHIEQWRAEPHAEHCRPVDSRLSRRRRRQDQTLFRGLDHGAQPRRQQYAATTNSSGSDGHWSPHAWSRESTNKMRVTKMPDSGTRSLASGTP